MSKTAYLAFSYRPTSGRKDRFFLLSEPYQNHKYLHISEFSENGVIVETRAYAAACNMAIFHSILLAESKAKKGYLAILRKMGYKLTKVIEEVDEEDEGRYTP